MFFPLEVLSSCAGSPQTNALPSEIKQVHPMRCLSFIKQQVSLLTLPKRPFCHSSFIICMVVVGTLPYFAACTCLLRGGELVVARERIRVIIECLKALGDVWKKGQNRVQELQAIGKEIIGATGPSNARMSESCCNWGDEQTLSDSYFCCHSLARAYCPRPSMRMNLLSCGH